MPYPRAKSRSINQTVYYDNRLSSFVKQPMQIGNLAVEKDETVGGNMNVGGNLRIGGDLSATNFYANNGNFFLDNYILIPYGTIIQSAAINTPNGWLLCNGASILHHFALKMRNGNSYLYSFTPTKWAF